MTAYSTIQISHAMKVGASVVSDTLNLGERDTDLFSLITNAIHTALDDPTATFDDVITAHYTETPDEIKSWWSGWS